VGFFCAHHPGRPPIPFPRMLERLTP